MSGDRVWPSVVLFDWGNTIMKDQPQMTTPMCQWPTVEAVDGAKEVLSALHSRCTIVLATGAAQSTEVDIWQALRRVQLDVHIDHVFCFANTGFRKPAETFYRHVLRTLCTQPSDAVMVGDDFESDVLGANRAGIPAIWLNASAADDKRGEHYRTIHHLEELGRLLGGIS